MNWVKERIGPLEGEITWERNEGVVLTAGLLVLLGGFLRLRQYFINRSLWLDEAALALNLVQKSFVELASPLDYDQGAPIGFLWVQKVIITFLGAEELSLRIFPLICGLLSLLLFGWIASAFLDKRDMLIALALFAIAGPLIYFTSEAKQYSTDVLAALVCLGMSLALFKPDLSLYGSLGCGLLGALLLWFSHPAFFVLLSIGLVGLGVWWKRGNKPKLGLFFTVSGIWGSSFIVLYFTSLQSLAKNENLLAYWQSAFAPSLNQPLDFVSWYVNHFLDVFKDPVGLPLIGLAAFLYMSGCLSIYQRNRPYFYSLVLPVLITIAAATAGKYPFQGRLLLFMTPLIIISVAAGTNFIITLLNQARFSFASVCLLGLVFFHPLLQAGDMLRHPQYGEDVRPVIEYIDARWQPDDLLYIYYGAYPAFEYYRLTRDWRIDNWQVGAMSRQARSLYVSDLDELQNHRRVWLIFSHVYSSEQGNEETFFINNLDQGKGTQLDKIQVSGASGYLYEF